MALVTNRVNSICSIRGIQMLKLVLFSVTCVTLVMLAVGTYAVSVHAVEVTNLAPPPSPWEVANLAPPPSPWEVAEFVEPNIVSNTPAGKMVGVLCFR